MEVIKNERKSAVESFIGKPRRCDATVRRGSKKCDFANCRYLGCRVVNPQLISDVISDVTAGVKTWGFNTIDHTTQKPIQDQRWPGNSLSIQRDQVVSSLALIYPSLSLSAAKLRGLNCCNCQNKTPKKGVSVSDPQSGSE
jgi:hypothetical protein